MKTTKRLLSLLVAILLIVPCFAFPASAELAYRTGANSVSSSYKNGRYYDNYTRLTLSDDDRNNLLAVALSQLGYQEGNAAGSYSGTVAGSSNYVEFSYNAGDWGLGYGGSDYPWCASFVSWCLFQSYCTDQGKASAMARNHSGDINYVWKEYSCSQWTTQLKNFSGMHKYSIYMGGSYTPKYGDLIFFRNSNGPCHIGLVLYVKNGYVYTVEGNTSSGTGLEANGGGVYFKSYSLSSSYIYSYGVLPFANTDNVSNIDYSGANPTAGLYMTNTAKYLYKDAACTTRATYSDGTYVTIPQYRMFEVTSVYSSSVLEATFDGVTGYVLNNSDRVIQVTESGNTNPDPSNIAYGAKYTTFQIVDGVRADVNTTTRGYTASLTDGIAATTLTAGTNNKEWFAFFDNSAATDENCSSGEGYILLDLGKNYDIGKIMVNVSNVAGTAPENIKVYLGDSEYGEYTELGSLVMPYSEYGYATINAHGLNGRYLRFVVTVDAYWAVLNEIKVYEASSITSAFESWTHNAMGATVTDDSGKTPLVSSSSGFVFANTLTDGKTNGVVNPVDGSWFTFQKWYNCDSNGVGSVTLDLGSVYDLEAIKLHLANSNMTVNYSTLQAYEPTSVKAYASVDGVEFTEVGTFKTMSGVCDIYWTGIATSAEARYIKIEMQVNLNGAYALLDEIAVFGTESKNYVNIAEGAVVMYAPSEVRNYNACLTDGIFAETLTPGTNNKDWYALFCNSAAADQNCASGVGEIVIDLGADYNLTKVMLHIAAVNGVNAPSQIIASVSESLNSGYTEIGTLSGTAEADGTYWVSANVNGMGRYLKLAITVDGYWAIFNEVQAYGTAIATENVSLNKTVEISRTNTGVTSTYHPIDCNASLTDGVVSSDSSASSIGNNTWFAFQTYSNTVVESGSFGTVGTATIDLGADYTLDNVKVHLANLNLVLSNGVSFAPNAFKVEVFVSNTADGEFVSVGSYDCSEKNDIFWADVEFANTDARYVKIAVTIDAPADGAYYAILDEIEVYALA